MPQAQLVAGTIQTVISASFAKECRSKFNTLKVLGDDKEQIAQDQRSILLWFFDDPDRIRAVGYDSGDLFDLVRDPEVAKALWGSESDIGIATINRLVRMVRQQARIPEINWFADLPKSITSTSSFSHIERLAKNIPETKGKDRTQAIADLRQVIAEISGRSWRDNDKHGKDKRASLYSFDATHAKIKLQGDGAVLSVLDTKYLHVLVHKIAPAPLENFSTDGHTITAWHDGKPETVATFLTQDEDVANEIADALRARRT